VVPLSPAPLAAATHATAPQQQRCLTAEPSTAANFINYFRLEWKL